MPTRWGKPAAPRSVVFKQTTMHRRIARGPIVRWSMNFSEQLALAIDARCGQLRISRVEYFEQLAEHDLRIASKQTTNGNEPPINDPSNVLA